MKRNDGRKKRKSYTYHEFPTGRGKIMCKLCGFPIKYHELDTHSPTPGSES